MIMSQRVKMISLNDEYEKQLKNKLGKQKKDYIGEVGTIIHRVTHKSGSQLCDVMFADGQVWCYDEKQLEEAYE